MTPAPSNVTAAILFMDIVKYSLQPADTQTELAENLSKIVQQTADYCRADAAGQLIKLPTGDGMALVFLEDMLAPVRCALEIAVTLRKQPSLQLRMGVNVGTVTVTEDINKQRNVAGEAINIAQRVMDGGDAGHILLSKSAAVALNQSGDWNNALNDWGLRQVKHGVQVHLYSLCKDGLGNKAVPIRLCESQATPSPVIALPAPPPLFVGREQELKTLSERLSQEGAIVPVPGIPGLGKTTLANEFAHRYKQDFDGVYWLQCSGKDLAALASGFAAQLGMALEGDLASILSALRAECGRKHNLLVLDNAEDESLGQLIPHGRAVVLITTRRSQLAFLTHQQPVKPDLFTDAECFDLFRSVLGEPEVTRSEASAKTLFEKLGYLPIAISVAAGLIKYDVHYTIDRLSNKLPPLDKLTFGTENVGALLKDAIAAIGEDELKLVTAMAVCAPDGFRLSLSVEIAELREEAALDALQGLRSRSLVEELDRSARRYRLHALIRTAADPPDALRLRHAEAIAKCFEPWETKWRECEHDLGDLWQAFNWTLGFREDPGLWGLCCDLASRGYRLTLRIGRLPEAHEFCERMARESEAIGDRESLQVSYGNQALILNAWGRLEEALALHKKEEAICEELGNRDGVQASYGNQGVILQMLGRLTEALTLHKKEETICEELGNRNGLQASYGNQAEILRVWGRLEEALVLVRKQEAICDELGDLDNLQRSYGNQAEILKDWARLDEALALLKKKEDLCHELGNRASLAICYWSFGDLARQRGDLKEARERAEAALAIFIELQMLREIEQVKRFLEGLG